MTKPEQKSGVLGLAANLDKKVNPFLSTDDMWEVQGFYPKESLSLTKRSGFSRFNTTQLDEAGHAATFTGMFEYVPSTITADRRQIATTEDGVFIYGEPTPSIWNPLSLTYVGGARTGTVDNLFDAATLEDQMYIGNGVDSNMRYDGVHPLTPALYNMGIVKPTIGTCAGVAAGSGGFLSAASSPGYKYRITFANRLNQESNASDPTAPIVTVLNDKITLSNIPVSADAQVTQRFIYRTVTNGEVYLYAGTIADNTTTTYEDTLADVNLSEEVDLFANGVPPLFSMIEIYRGVAFMAGGPNKSRIYFSFPGFPTSVDSNDFRDLDPNDGDVITGIHKFQNTIVVTKNNSVWNLIGEDRNTFGFEKRVTSAGSVGNTCILEIPTKNTLVMLSNHPRFFKYDGVIAAPTAAEIEPVLRALNQNKLAKAVGSVVSSQNQCRWIVPNSGKNYCDLMIWYDYILEKWGTVDLASTPANFCATMRDVDGVVRFYLCAAYDSGTATGGGRVWQGDTGGSDNLQAISVSVIDRGHPKGDPSQENQKCFYHVFVWYEYTGVTPAPVISVYGLKDDPDGTPILIGQITCDKPSGQDHLHMNMTCRRLYIKISESSTIEGLVLRGWRLYFKDVGRHHAP